jgi:hypothetical protein
VEPPTETIDPEIVVADVYRSDQVGRPANVSRKAFTNDETSKVDVVGWQIDSHRSATVIAGLTATGWRCQRRFRAIFPLPKKDRRPNGLAAKECRISRDSASFHILA